MTGYVKTPEEAEVARGKLNALGIPSYAQQFNGQVILHVDIDNEETRKAVNEVFLSHGRV